jgi:tetratricopeptide (TPR) repeat protein
MADDKEYLGDNLQEEFGSFEQFVEEKKQPLLIGGGVLLVLAVALVFVFMKWLPDRNVQAQKAMYMAEFAFGKDSFEVALNGRAGTMGVAPFDGFTTIANKYSWTKAANLSNYYAGICCMHLKKYDEAVKYLDKFSTSDPIVGALRLNALGDANMELGKTEEGIKYYAKAADFSDNEAYTPLYLLKAGEASEKEKKYDDAKKYYEKIHEKYPASEEGRDIERYLARVNAAQ